MSWLSYRHNPRTRRSPSPRLAPRVGPSPSPPQQGALSKEHQLRALELTSTSPLKYTGKRYDTIRILKELQELHKEKKSEMAAKKWLAARRAQEQSKRPTSLADVVRTATREKEFNSDIVRLPMFAEADPLSSSSCHDKDIESLEVCSLSNGLSDLPIIESELFPEIEAEPANIIPGELEASTQATRDTTQGTEAPKSSPVEERNRRTSKWTKVNEKYRMAVAQEKVVLMNKVVGKINYAGRVSSLQLWV